VNITESGEQRRRRRVERQRLRVGLAKLDVQPFGCRAFAGTLEQRGHVVGGDHIAPATRGRQRGVAVAGGDVEHPVSRTDVEGLAQLLADDLKRGAYYGIIAGRPCSPLAGLERIEVWMAAGLAVLTIGGSSCIHELSPFGRYCDVSPRP
jgi:hypothetical protein